jgi:hypothetical protein
MLNRPGVLEGLYRENAALATDVGGHITRYWQLLRTDP